MTPRLKSVKGYKRVQADTSSPEKLLLMVYSGTIKFLKTGKLLYDKDRHDKGRLYLLKAIAALVELIATLNHQESPEIAGSLKQLYVYVMDRLRKAVQNNTTEEIEESLHILCELKSAWQQAFANSESGRLEMAG